MFPIVCGQLYFVSHKDVRNTLYCSLLIIVCVKYKIAHSERGNGNQNGDPYKENVKLSRTLQSWLEERVLFSLTRCSHLCSGKQRGVGRQSWTQIARSSEHYKCGILPYRDNSGLSLPVSENNSMTPKTQQHVADNTSSQSDHIIKSTFIHFRLVSFNEWMRVEMHRDLISYVKIDLRVVARLFPWWGWRRS